LWAVGRPAARVAPAEPARAKPSPPAKEVTVSGSVLSPAGKPLAGAEVLLVGKGKTPRKLAVTGADGKFAVKAPRGQRWVYLLAWAPGVGVDFLDLGLLPAGEVELHLVKDHPIRGRVIDTEGKPVRGVT